MTPHEEEMMTEIEDLHRKLAESEKGRIKWMLIAIAGFIALGILLWFQFR